MVMRLLMVLPCMMRNIMIILAIIMLMLTKMMVIVSTAMMTGFDYDDDEDGDCLHFISDEGL